MHLFDGVRYFLSTSLPEGRINELSHVLDQNGATSVNSIDDESLTHFITNSNSFERWQDVAAREEAKKLVVVTDKWVDKSLLLGKLQLPSYYSADPAMIFSGVVACAAELEPADLEVLSAGITGLGGQWRTGLTKDVTHLFVTKSTSKKYSTALHFREDTQVKILLPHWFDDAVRLGISGLKTTPYEWPDPPMLRARGEGGDETEADALKRAALRKLDSEKKSLYRTADLLFPGAPLPNGDKGTSQSSVQSPRKTKNVWEARRVLLSRSLELSGTRLDAVESEIRRAGGNVVLYEGGKDEEAAAVDQCDVFVTRFRSGKAYVQAVRHVKTIGTLPWVFHVHATGTLSAPMDQLLWYPIPRRPIEGFSGHEITVTNYTGESREYIKKLIVAMGAVFTPSMSGKNTVLIAAYVSGTKTTKAASWSIPIVNHLWLEDCFVKWRNLTVALEKYIVFPPGVDFSRQLGDRGVGREVEEIGDDELEMLEQEEEEEEEETAVAADLEQEALGADKGKEKAREVNGMSYPLGTPGSSQDAQEVQDVVGIDIDGDVDGHMEVELPDIQDEVDDPMVLDDLKDDRMDEEEAPAPSRPTLTPRSAKSIAERMQDKGESSAKTRIKPRSKGKPKPPSDRSSTPEVHITKRKSGQLDMTPGKKRSRSSSSSSDDEVEPVAKKNLVRRVGQRSDSWIMDAVVLTPLPVGKKAGQVNERAHEEEEEEEAPKQLRRGLLKKSPSKQVLSSGESEHEEVAATKKGKNVKGKNVRKTNTFVDDEVSEASDVSAKKGKKARSEDEEDFEEQAANSTCKGRKTAVAPSKTMKGKERLSSPLSDDDEPVVIASTSKGKNKATEVERPRPRPVGKNKVVEHSQSEEEEHSPPPLKKLVPKASSSKLKKISPASVSDEDEPPSSKKVAAKSLASTSKKPATPPSSEEDDEHPPSTKVTKSRRATYKSRKTAAALEPEEEVDLSPSKKAPAKSRVSIAKAKKAATPPVSDDDDELTPPPPSPPKKAPRKPLHAAPQTSKKGKSKLVSSDEDEDEDNPPQRSKTKPTVNSSGRAEPVHKPLPSTAPKRTVSVILPTLSLSTKKSLPSNSTAAPNDLSRTKSIRAVADERASTTRKATASGSASKPKPKAKPPPATKDDASTTSGRVKRGAAERASQKLHEEIMPDVMHYQQQMRNAGKGRQSLPGLPNGSSKKRQSIGANSDDEEDARGAKRQRLSGKATASEDEVEVQEIPKPSKGKGKHVDTDEGEPVKAGKTQKAKGDLDSSGDSRVGSVRLMTTQVTLTDDVIKTLTKLGVKITVKPSECTHLLAPHLVRTEKFLCSLAGAPFILTEKWATESAAAKKLLGELLYLTNIENVIDQFADERKYLLRDKTNEKKFDFVLADALSRAKELRGTLFSKMEFYITPKVPVQLQLLKNVVTACGGQVNGHFDCIPQDFLICLTRSTLKNRLYG
ncbi:hypothetical protein C0991_001873 [Blastosporella zonata]|nr:hypothetical protein C0991_001873 [Blastosporella zonata]